MGSEPIPSAAKLRDLDTGRRRYERMVCLSARSEPFEIEFDQAAVDRRQAMDVVHGGVLVDGVHRGAHEA